MRLIQLCAFCSIAFMLSFAQAQVSNLAKGHDSGKPVEVTADSLEVHQEKQVATFLGSVEAVQGGLKITADKMHVYYREKKEGTSNENAVSKIIAVGDVFVSSNSETAKAKKAVFDVDKNTITMLGDVVLTNGKNVVKGAELIYNITSGQSKLVSGSTTSGGRVKGVFIPNSKKK